MRFKGIKDSFMFDWFRRQIQLAPEVKALIQSEAKRTGNPSKESEMKWIVQ